jgi:hypothetical protein
MNNDVVKRAVMALQAALLAVAMPTWAHHSFAVYDMKITKSADGVIKEFNFGAPHSTATFIIQDANGRYSALTLQGAAPAALARAGFQARDFSKGTKVHISWHPVRTGGPSGALISMKLPDGRVYEDMGIRGLGAPPPGGGPGAGGPPPGGGPPGAVPPQSGQ